MVPLESVTIISKSLIGRGLVFLVVWVQGLYNVRFQSCVCPVYEGSMQYHHGNVCCLMYEGSMQYHHGNVCCLMYEGSMQYHHGNVCCLMFLRLVVVFFNRPHVITCYFRVFTHLNR